MSTLYIVFLHVSHVSKNLGPWKEASDQQGGCPRNAGAPWCLVRYGSCTLSWWRSLREVHISILRTARGRASSRAMLGKEESFSTANDPHQWSGVSLGSPAATVLGLTGSFIKAGARLFASRCTRTRCTAAPPAGPMTMSWPGFWFLQCPVPCPDGRIYSLSASSTILVELCIFMSLASVPLS